MEINRSRDEAIGVKSQSEHILEMAQSKLGDVDQRKSEAIDKFEEVKDNMYQNEKDEFQAKIGYGDGLREAGYAEYYTGQEKDHLADIPFNEAEEHWSRGEWDEANVDFESSIPNYQIAVQKYGAAEQKWSSALGAYDDAWSYAFGFEEQP